MDRLLICNIPMQDVKATHYEGQDSSVKTSDEKVYLPINARLATMLEAGDHLRVVGIAKMDKNGNYLKNVEKFKAEFDALSEKTGAEITFSYIESEFDETIDVHNKLLLELIDSFAPGESIMADMTYGPKDLVVILFAALPFADRFSNCDIDAIMYGKVSFDENHTPQEGVLYEMAQLYHLNSIHNRINCNSLDEAKAVLKLLV